MNAGAADQSSAWAGSLLRSRTLGQAAVFTAASVVTSLLGAVAKALLARLLTVTTFGVFAFAASFLQFGALLFEFGLFVPASRLAARREGLARRELLGAALLAYVPVGAVFVAAVFVSSLAVDSLFRVHAAPALAATAPLAIVYPFAFVALQLTQGVGRLHVYAIANVAGQVAFVALLLLLTLTGVGRNATVTLGIRAATLGLGWVILVIWLRPVFKHARRHVSVLIAQARDYGFQVYLGRILSIGTYNMDVMMLAALTDARTVGLYTLAGAVAAAVGLPISGMASALFPRMTRERRLQSKWLAASWVVGLVGAAAAAALAPPFIRLVFSGGYAQAADLVLPLALAEAVRGVTSVYNAYLSAQALGRALRNAGAVLTLSNLALNLALIPRYGAAGAAWASLFALLANLLAHVIGYRRHVDGGALPPPDGPSVSAGAFA